MTEVENMSVKEMLGIINVPSIECVMMTDDAKKEIISRFEKEQDKYKALQTFYDAMTDEVIKLKEMIAEKDKVIELMAREIQDYRKYNAAVGYMSIEETTRRFTERAKKKLQVKQELQADKEKADES